MYKHHSFYRFCFEHPQCADRHNRATLGDGAQATNNSVLKTLTTMQLKLFTLGFKILFFTYICCINVSVCVCLSIFLCLTYYPPKSLCCVHLSVPPSTYCRLPMSLARLPQWSLIGFRTPLVPFSPSTEMNLFKILIWCGQ